MPVSNVLNIRTDKCTDWKSLNILRTVGTSIANIYNRGAKTLVMWYTILVDVAVPSHSIVSPSLHVQWGNTPLLRAAQEGHAEVTHFLLENGSNVHEQNSVSRPQGVLSTFDHLMLFAETCVPLPRNMRKCAVRPSWLVKLSLL